jgi:hypothetical protein
MHGRDGRTCGGAGQPFVRTTPPRRGGGPPVVGLRPVTKCPGGIGMELMLNGRHGLDAGDAEDSPRRHGGSTNEHEFTRIRIVLPFVPIRVHSWMV